MSFMKDLRVGKEIENILLSKYAQIFSEYLARFLENPNFYDQLMAYRSEKKPVWLILLENIAHKEFQGVPMLVHNYCALRAKEAYQRIKRMSKRENVKIADAARLYRKLCNKVIQNGIQLKTASNKDMNSPQGGFTKMHASVNGKFNFSPHMRFSKKASLPSIVKVLNINFKMSNEKDLKDEDDEIEKEKSENMLDQIKRKNKLNIYVGGFETYTSKNPHDIEKVKIYEGKMCSTFFLNSHAKKKNYEKSSHGQIDVRKIIKKEGGIFIPNDVVKIKPKDMKDLKELRELNITNFPSQRKTSDLSSIPNINSLATTSNNSPSMAIKRSLRISTTDVKNTNENINKGLHSNKPSCSDFKLISTQQETVSFPLYKINKDKSIFSYFNKLSPRINTVRSTAHTAPGTTKILPDTGLNINSPTNLIRSSSRNKVTEYFEDNVTLTNKDNLFTDANSNNSNNFNSNYILSSPNYIGARDMLNQSIGSNNFQAPLNTVSAVYNSKFIPNNNIKTKIFKNKSYKIINNNSNATLTKSANVMSMKHYKTAKNKKSSKKQAIMEYFNFFNKKDMYYD